MPYIEPEVILQAKRMNLLTYSQNYEPQELVHVSGNIYSTRTHDSMRISKGKWCWWSRSIGGKSALDYLIKINGFSFVKAVEQIMGRAAIDNACAESIYNIVKTEFSFSENFANFDELEVNWFD